MAHHFVDVHLEPWAHAKFGSNRSSATSASWSFSLSASPVSPPLTRLTARLGPSALQLDSLVVGGDQHLDLPPQGMGLVGKGRRGCERSVRRLLVGRKPRIGVFSAAPADGRQERQEGRERELEGAEDDARATSHANTSRFMPSYQRLAAPSCSRSPPSWRSWRPSPGAAENAPFRGFLPTSSQRTLPTTP